MQLDHLLPVIESTADLHAAERALDQARRCAAALQIEIMFIDQPNRRATIISRIEYYKARAVAIERAVVDHRLKQEVKTK